MTRYIELDSEELKALVEAKGEVVAKGRKHYQNMVELNDAGNEIAAERNVIVAQILELTSELLKDEELSEFELATTTDIKGDTVRVEIVDRVAQFKNNMREEKARADRKEAGEMTPEEAVEDKQQRLVEAIKGIAPEEVSETLDKLLDLIG